MSGYGLLAEDGTRILNEQGPPRPPTGWMIVRFMSFVLAGWAATVGIGLGIASLIR